MKDWKVLLTSESLEHLEIVRINLKENCAIEAVILNKKISAYQLGIAELLVANSDFDQAKRFLEQ
ncbi:MAG: hypothetical protein RJA76_105 [Bacteroidota bacterium]|jgi:hypothetical protein